MACFRENEAEIARAKKKCTFSRFERVLRRSCLSGSLTPFAGLSNPFWREHIAVEILARAISAPFFCGKTQNTTFWLSCNYCSTSVFSTKTFCSKDQEAQFHFLEKKNLLVRLIDSVREAKRNPKLENVISRTVPGACSFISRGH